MQSSIFFSFLATQKETLGGKRSVADVKNTMKAYISVLLFFSKRRNEPFAQKRIMCKKGKYIKCRNGFRCGQPR